MLRMHRSACLLHIGAREVHGLWQPPSWSKASGIEATAEFKAGQPAELAHPVAGTLDAVLGAILPKRQLTSPYVRVSLAGCHVMAAILPFVTLPKSAGDRSLLISQRFCREHRLEPTPSPSSDVRLGPRRSRKVRFFVSLLNGACSARSKVRWRDEASTPTSSRRTTCWIRGGGQQRRAAKARHCLAGAERLQYDPRLGPARNDHAHCHDW